MAELRMECGNAPLAVIEGCVEHGRRLGRELGFPTANLSVPDDLALDDGVYRSRVEVAGRRYDAMSNLGRNPSVGGTERRLETHIFGFTGELYGCRLRVELLQRIRGEQKFASVEELRSRIEQDREEILKSING
jgi:riboflavin kinase/FMN adenylyltransferase